MAAARKLWHEWWGGGGCWRLHRAQEEPCGAQRRWESARAVPEEAMRMGCGAEKLRGSGFSGVKKMCFTLEVGGGAPAWGVGQFRIQKRYPWFWIFRKNLRLRYNICGEWYPGGKFLEKCMARWRPIFLGLGVANSEFKKDTPGFGYFEKI